MTATNSLLTIDMITKKALAILHDKLNFVSTINRQYDKEFAQDGAKIGTTLRVRKPNRYAVGTSNVASASNTTESKIDLAVTSRANVMVEFGAAEQALSLQDYASRILEPAMAAIASKVEQTALTMALQVPAVISKGTTEAADLSDIFGASAELSEYNTPEGDRFGLLSPSQQASYLNLSKGLFNPGPDVSRQNREGYVGMFGGFEFGMSNRLPTMTANPADIAGAVNQPSAYVAGATSLVVDTFTDGQIIPQGATFTVAGTNAVNPETGIDLGYLYRFVHTGADVTVASNGGTLTIAGVYASGVNKNVTALPANDAVVTILGTASKSYKTSLLYHRDAFTLATADLQMLEGGLCSRANYDGLSLRVAKDSDIYNDTNICRIDMLYGFAALRPEWARRILTQI